MAKKPTNKRQRVVGVSDDTTMAGNALKQQIIDQAALNKVSTEGYALKMRELQAGRDLLSQVEQEQGLKRQQLEDEKAAGVSSKQRKKTLAEIAALEQDISKLKKGNKQVTMETAEQTSKIDDAQQKLNSSQDKYNQLKQDEKVITEQIAGSVHEQKQTLIQMYGEQKDYAQTLQVAAGMEKEIAAQKRRNLDMSLEDRALLETTIADRSTINASLVEAAKESAKLTLYEREKIPHMDKIKSIQAEMVYLQQQQGQGLTEEQGMRLAALGDMEKQYTTLSKLEQRNNKIKDINKEIQDLVFGQNTAFGQVMSTLKDIVTNPLTLFTGLLALGVKRYETMRQRGNQLAEEMDRVNKKLAGAGSYQTNIIKHAKTIQSEFSRAGEGFAQSMESAVDSTVALANEFGKVGYVSAELVETMGQLKLGLGLSDEESAKVLNNFDDISGLTKGAASNAADMTYQLAEQHGLDPAAPFRDIAAASGETLGYFSGGAVALGKAAVQAKRMGLTLDDMAGVAKSLLDFETSIEKEMEAQLITGMDLDFSQARRLAMMGKTGDAVQNVLDQVGGHSKFLDMMPHQQKALADSVGLSVSQLRKTNVEREREAKHADDKQKLVGKSLAAATTTTRVLGKLETGLGVIEKISNVIGDIFLEVFGPTMKKTEDWFMKFIQGDAFKNGLKNVLHMVKGIIEGVGDAIKSVMGFVDKITGGKIGSLISSFTGGLGGQKDFSGAEETGGKIGKYGAMIGGGIFLASKLLGTRFNPMHVTSSGGMFGGGDGGGGTDMISKLTRGINFLSGKGMRSGSKTSGMTRILNATRGGGLKGGSKAMGRMIHGSRIAGMGNSIAGAFGSSGTAMGGTALGGAGVVAGGVLGAAAIGKGIYDVASLDNMSTNREKTTAKGGLGGALGGAAMGAAIGSFVPVIGTVLGAGIGAAIGYFGGRAIGSMDAFADKLDKSRDNLADSAKKLSREKQVFDQTMELKAKVAHASVYADFKKMSKGLDLLVGDPLAEFGQKMVLAGNITQKAFDELAKDGLTLAESQLIASGASDKVATAFELQQKAITDSTIAEAAKLDVLRTQQANATKGASQETFGQTFETLAAGGVIDKSDFGKMNTERTVKGWGGDIQQNSSSITNSNVQRWKGAYVPGTKAYEDIARRDTSGTFEKKAAKTYSGAQEYASAQMSMSGNALDKETMDRLMKKVMTDNKYNFVGTAKQTEEQLNKLTRDISAARAQELELQANTLEKTIMEKQAKAFKEYSSEKGVLDVNITNSDDLKNKPTSAAGSILQGPSHASGGIPTEFGELEGGEAVINKRSTAMFTSELSDINQAGGGVPLGTENSSGKFGLGGNLLFKTIAQGGEAGSNIYSGYKASKTLKAGKGLMADGSYQVPPSNALEAVFENKKIRNIVSMMEGAKGTQTLVNMGLKRFGFGALKLMPKLLARAVPGLGWGLLAYDIGKLVVNMMSKSMDAAGVHADNERKRKNLEDAMTAAKEQSVADNITKGYGGSGLQRPLGADMYGEGGVIPSPPITKVNDMILTKDGQMIETHEDDNLIAKKGGITQNTGNSGASGNSELKELLKELIIVTKELGNRPIEMDGSRVSQAINESNYLA